MEKHDKKSKDWGGAMLVTFRDELMGTEITIDPSRRDDVVYERGALICRVAPLASIGCPLTLGIAITPDGRILHRGWDWNGMASAYLHVEMDDPFIDVTPAMKETVEGLFSGRITVDGLKIAVGASVQKVVSGLDIATEEQRVGKTLYLA